MPLSSLPKVVVVEGVQLCEVQITNVVSMALPNKCRYKLLSSYSILTVPQHKA